MLFSICYLKFFSLFLQEDLPLDLESKNEIYQYMPRALGPVHFKVILGQTIGKLKAPKNSSRVQKLWRLIL